MPPTRRKPAAGSSCTRACCRRFKVQGSKFKVEAEGMATFKRFEDIEAWQRAREITRRIYALSNDGPFLRDHGLRDQVRRAAVSVMANIAEGFGRGGNRE